MADPCTDKALQLLALRPHFRRELERKLLGRDFEPDVVAATLERLVELRYLDEVAAVRGFVEQRLRRGPVGRRRLEADLSRRGAEAAVVTSVLDELLAGDDRPAALEAALAWTRGRQREPAAVARHLERKGFSRRAIFAVLDELRRAAEAPESFPEELSDEPYDS